MQRSIGCCMGALARCVRLCMLSVPVMPGVTQSLSGVDLAYRCTKPRDNVKYNSCLLRKRGMAVLCARVKGAQYILGGRILEVAYAQALTSHQYT